MREKINGIKTAIEACNIAEDQLAGLNGEQIADKLAAETGFKGLDSVIKGLQKKAESAIKTIKSFLPFQKKTRKELETLNEQHSKELKKAQENEASVREVETSLEMYNSDLAIFKAENQLTEFDLEKPLWSFGVVLMMVGLTGVEILLSYVSLSQYFDGYTTLIGVNGGLGLFSSLLAMLAGQFLRINIRIKKELKRFNNAPATKAISLPKWVQEHPNVDEKNNKYQYKTGFMNFLIIAFMIGCAVITVLKFSEPLRDNNTMAYVICGVVIAVNLIGFVAYEFFSYSGLTYTMRAHIDKKLKRISRLQDKLSKLHRKSQAPLAIERKYNEQLSSIIENYNKRFAPISSAQSSLQEIEETYIEIGNVVESFEAKLGQLTHKIPDYSRLKKLLRVSEYPVIVNLFVN